jgi:hypothetical protein
VGDEQIQLTSRPNAQSSVAFSVASEHVRRTDRRTSPQRASPHEQLNGDRSDIVKPHADLARADGDGHGA